MVWEKFMMPETFRMEDIQNAEDQAWLRRGKCPWCLRQLTPVFENDQHVADECSECGDKFKG